MEAILWTDSMDVLGWIGNTSRNFKPFVADRVGKIQTKTEPSKWKYVPSSKNPADLASRGCKVAKLSTTWIHGPEFLCESEENWPTSPQKMISLKETKRIPRTESSFLVLERDNNWRLQAKNYSKWSKLVRVSAWVRRFVENSRTGKENRTSGELRDIEIEDAQIRIIREAQMEAFPVEYGCIKSESELPKLSKLLPLNPKMDKDNLIRSNNRINKYA